MGIARFFKSIAPHRLGIAIGLALCAIAGFVALATAAGGQKPRPAAKKQRINQVTLARIIESLRSRDPLTAFVSHGRLTSGVSLGATGATGAPVGGTGVTSTPSNPSTPVRVRRPRPSPPLSTRVFAVAIDGAYTYALTTSKKSNLNASNPNFAITLVRRNTATGERAKLLTFRKSIPLLLRAGGGRAIVWQLGSSGRHLTTTVLAFDQSSAVPVTVLSDNLSFAASSSDLSNFGAFCGRLSSLNGVDDAGEPLVTRLTVTCTTDRQTDFKLETVAIGHDGTQRVIDPAPSLGMLLAGRSQLVGDRLLQTGPLLAAVTQVATTSGERSLLWSNGDSARATISPDGSVAIGGGFSFGNSVGDVFGTGSSRNGPPLVIFPQGDADRPVMVGKPNSTSLAFQYCGTRLYELQAARLTQLDPLAEVLSWFNDDLPFASKLKVIERDAAGGAARPIALTGRVWVRSLACDGDTLLMATSNGANVTLSRFGP